MSKRINKDELLTCVWIDLSCTEKSGNKQITASKALHVAHEPFRWMTQGCGKGSVIRMYVHYHAFFVLRTKELSILLRRLQALGIEAADVSEKQTDALDTQNIGPCFPSLNLPRTGCGWLALFLHW